ncbi:MAG: glycosyltransferase, partial [Parvibaculum sp.]
HMAASDATRFVYLGRLDSEKALDWMIEGFAKLPSKAETRLVIVGDGPCGNELKALAIRLGISDRVEFPGRVDDVAPYLETADFYLSTSLSEGMSNALLEAMSYAVPPLVSRVSGVDDMVIDGKSGLLFEAGNIAAYTSKLLAAIAMSPDDRHSMGQAAAATVRDRFGMDKVTDQHIALYDSLMATKTASAIRQ